MEGGSGALGGQEYKEEIQIWEGKWRDARRPLPQEGGSSRLEGTVTVRERRKKNPIKPKVKRSPPTSIPCRFCFINK